EQAPKGMEQVSGRDLEILEGLLHGTKTSSPLASTLLSSQPHQDTLQLFLAVSQVLIKVARHDPLLLLVDDLHWAGRPSLDLLSHIIFAMADAAVRAPVPLLLIGAYRPVEPAERLARVLARLQREEICQTWELTGLNEAEVTALVQGLGVAHPSHQLI